MIRKMLMIAFLIPLLAAPVVAEDEKVPVSVVVVFEAYELKPNNPDLKPDSAAPETIVMGVVFTPYPLEFGKALICKGKAGARRYMVEAYRLLSSNTHQFQLGVGQYAKKGFSAIFSAELQDGLNVSSSISDTQAPFRVNIIASTDKNELRQYLNWKKEQSQRRGEFQEMECRVAADINELNKFLVE